MIGIYETDVDKLLDKREVCEDIGKQFEPERVKKMIRVPVNKSPDTNNKEVIEVKDDLACDEVSFYSNCARNGSNMHENGTFS